MYVHPHLEYCIQSWCPYLARDIDILEKVQRYATKCLQGLTHLSCQYKVYSERSIRVFSKKPACALGRAWESIVRAELGFQSSPGNSASRYKYLADHVFQRIHALQAPSGVITSHLIVLSSSSQGFNK